MCARQKGAALYASATFFAPRIPCGQEQFNVFPEYTTYIPNIKIIIGILPNEKITASL
jgi:hypothetical protein